MATCMDCIHFNICNLHSKIIVEKDSGGNDWCMCEDVENHCFQFKNKADFVEVKHGEWKHTVEKGNVYNHHFFNCSLCGASAFTSGYEKYCHECGAKMDGERKENND